MITSSINTHRGFGPTMAEYMAERDQRQRDLTARLAYARRVEQERETAQPKQENR